MLKGEGTINGTIFTLTGWRREGLLARLHANGFRVETLEDQIDALPTPPRATPPGAACQRRVRGNERYSWFAPLQLAWVPVAPPEHEHPPTIWLYDSAVVCCRRGRGPGSYHHVGCDAHHYATLITLSERDALLTGYAQAALLNHPPLAVQQRGEHSLLPALPLPPPYRALLRRIAEQTSAGWQVDAAAWPLACALYGRLGLTFAHA
jgi:hypothetical protein